MSILAALEEQSVLFPVTGPGASTATRVTARDISVVICAYTEKRWEQLCEAVESVIRAGASDVIVVIDHNPGLLARATDRFAAASVLENTYPPGLSGARNSGVERAQGGVIAFIDDDAVATPGWLEELADGYASDSTMAVGGHIKPLWQDDTRPSWFPQEFDWVVGCSYRGLPSQSAPVRNLIGCNMSFRRSVFEDVGGFVSGIGRIGAVPVGCEETEFCIRATRQRPDQEILYRPSARVWHLVEASRESVRYFLSRCFAEGRSKAQVTAAAGLHQGLSSERTYVSRTLPAGVMAGWRDVLHGDAWGAARSGAIIAGLAVTAVGYLKGRVVDRPGHAVPAGV